MPNGYGQAGHIGIAKETSGGTPVSAAYYMEAISEDLAASIDRFETRNIIGGYYEPDDSPGVKRIGGGIVVPSFPEDLGYFLLGAMGVQSNTELTNLHRHEFTMRTSDWDTKFAQQPMTLEVFRDVASAQQYAGCNISQIELGIAPNQEVRLSASIIGKAEADIQQSTPTFTSSPSAPFTFDTCSISIGGAGVDKIEGINLLINNQLEGVPTLNNSDEISRIRRTGSQLIRLSGTLSFEDTTEYRNFIDQNEQVFTVSFFKAASFQMIWDLPRVVYTAFPLSMPGRERQTVSFEGMARYDVGSASAAKIDLYNTTSGY